MGGSAYAGSLIAGATVTNNQANFTTSGLYVNLPSGLFGSYAAVSVEAWVTTGFNTGNARIFQFGVGSGTSNNNCVGVSRFTVTGSYRIWWVDANNDISAETTQVLFDSKTNVHVVLTVSAGDFARLYINSVLVGSTPAVVDPLPPPSFFYIGMGSSSPLIGSVNEFRIWGGALSATDIATRYSQGPGDTRNEPF